MTWRRSPWLVLLLILFVAPVAVSLPIQTGTVFLGWSPAEPYLPREGAGLDLPILQTAAERAGLTFAPVELDPRRAAAALREGRVDLIAGIHDTIEARARGRLSAPYRFEEFELFARPDLVAGLPQDSPANIVAALLAGNLRLGLARGHDHGPGLRSAFVDPGAPGAHLVVWSESTAESLRALRDGQVDAVVADRLTMLALMARHRDKIRVAVLPVVLHRPAIHLLIGGDALSPPAEAALNKALEALLTDGTTERLRARIAGPTLLAAVVPGHGLAVLDIVGTIAFAVSGVLIARREGWSVFGALVLAALPAVGGGVVRDLLIGRRPILILDTPQPLLLVLGTVLAGYVLFRIGDALRRRREAGAPAGISPAAPFAPKLGRYLPPHRIYEVSDALGLAAFTVAGVLVAMRFGAEPLWLWGPLLAALTGAGGGILRDVVRADSGNPALRTSFYAEICLLWGLVLSLVLPFAAYDLNPRLLQGAIVGTVLGAFLTRLLAVRYSLRSPRF